MATRIYGAKKDANHALIVTALERVGASVLDISGVGGGCPDLLAWFGGEWHLIEIKNPKTSYGRRGLNRLQKNWSDRWRGGPVAVVRTPEEALRAIGALAA